ncbi:MAG: aspartyl/asparaginyl beta-hydroxylase domain-containing protein [Vicingaceae bacterium]
METTATAKDRVQLNLNFKVEKLIEEVNKLEINSFLYYNVITLRGPAHLVDPNLPPPPAAEDFADGSWTDWKNTADLEKSPYLKEIVDFFDQHSKVTLVRLLRLEAGETVKEHTDPTLGLEVEKSVIRLTIPIISPEEVEFYLNQSIVHMKPGECWYLKLTDPHKVINKSSSERVNLTLDMRPNDWLKKLIAESEKEVG